MGMEMLELGLAVRGEGRGNSAVAFIIYNISPTWRDTQRQTWLWRNEGHLVMFGELINHDKS